MKTRENRVLALFLVAACLALLATWLGPVLLDLVIKPVASGLWLLVRLFVLSVDQWRIWAVALLAFCALVAYRLARSHPGAPTPAEEKAAEPNSALGDLKYWRYMFEQVPRDARERTVVQRELALLLCSVYASRRHVPADLELFDDFRLRRISLPKGIHALLFGDASAGTGRSRPRPRLAAWLRRVSGREGADYRRGIEEYLEFLESQMEMNDDEQ